MICVQTAFTQFWVVHSALVVQCAPSGRPFSHSPAVQREDRHSLWVTHTLPPDFLGAQLPPAHCCEEH